MHDLLQQLVEQNEKLLEQNDKIVALLDIIAQRLEPLDEVRDLLASIDHEMQWHENMTTASQVIKAVGAIEDAVRS